MIGAVWLLSLPFRVSGGRDTQQAQECTRCPTGILDIAALHGLGIGRVLRLCCPTIYLPACYLTAQDHGA